MTPDEFRRLGHQLIDWIADYRQSLDQQPVMAEVSPGILQDQLPEVPPLAPEPFEAILADLDRLIVPGLTHWQHPRFFGYFPANAPYASVLGDLVSGGLGVLGLNWQAAPALTELEQVVADWVRQMVGLSPRWQGTIQDTASTSTLVALLCAREQTTGYSLARAGLQAETQPLTVYVSTQSHSSVMKGALLAGFGVENVRAVLHDDSYAMRPDCLSEMVRTDHAEGKRPCAVIATTGTTASTAMDPLAPIADVAAKFSMWLHVDAAMAGSAMILPECRPLWEGVEQADSVVLDPHKWLGASFDCSLYFVRNPDHLIRVMGTNPSYLQTASDRQVRNYRDWGIALGRRFRALKLWFLIRSSGVSGLQHRLRRDLENARWLAEQVANAPQWRVVAPVQLQTVCVRHEPAGLSPDELNLHQQSWADRVNRGGMAYLTPAILGDAWMVRISIGNEATERRDVEIAWQAIRQEAEKDSL